jgi:prophage regulatory protein
MELYKIKELVELLKISRATIYRKVSENEFPKPIKIGRGTFWRKEDITNWLQNL